MGANDIDMQVSSESPSYDVLGKIRSSVTTVSSSSRAVVLFSLVLLLGALFSLSWINSSFFTSTTTPLPFTCPTGNSAIRATCSSAAAAATTTTNNKTTTPVLPLNQTPLLSPTCPAYFRWIHEDLRPWNSTGITQEMLDRASKHANFRLLVVDGRAYLDRNRGAFQTRDVFTIWGVLQLLRRYPGRVPDLDLMFNCEDMPVVRSADYNRPNSPAPPPLFRYCKDDTTVDIVFPDWSFWGWPEINIKPWEVLMVEMTEGNKRMKWVDREPHAYWKGNPRVSKIRQQLLTCNVSKGREWNARVYAQNWDSEIKQGFKGSDLANQCHYRYKIYIDGRAWSVSEKYILACDSPMLMVRSRFHDFFSRGLMPMKHYWPIREDDKCRSIKFAVEWGNSHQQEMADVSVSNETETIVDEKMIEDETHVPPPTVPEILSAEGLCFLCTLSPRGSPSEWTICDSCFTQLEEGNQTNFQSQGVVVPPPTVPIAIPEEPCYLCTLYQGGTPSEWILCDDCFTQLEHGKWCNGFKLLELASTTLYGEIICLFSIYYWASYLIRPHVVLEKNLSLGHMIGLVWKLLCFK